MSHRHHWPGVYVFGEIELKYFEKVCKKGKTQAAEVSLYIRKEDREYYSG